MHNSGDIDIAEYSYELPHHRIADFPLEKRDQSKLLVSNPNREIFQDTFYNLAEFLPPDSLIVFNNTKVVQARLRFKKKTGAEIEIFCIEPKEPVKLVDQAFNQSPPVVWKCFIGNARKWKEQELELKTSYGKLKASKLRIDGDAWQVKFSWSPSDLTWAEILEDIGHVPLPPYIKREDNSDDKWRYQTLYARSDGSVAAPTAGLHFSDSVFEKLENKHISKTFLTLHVGAGTFKPVADGKLSEHEMHKEQIVVSLHTVEQLLVKTKEKTIAVGTTSVRTLESLYWYGCALKRNPDMEFFVGQWEPYKFQSELSRKEALELLIEKMKREGREFLQGETRLMIIPGYDYKMTGAMITNFHQPKSTLLLLVAAFVGNRWKDAYQFALDHDFRFLSYGDSCLFFPDKVS